MRALGELLAYRPVAGSFATYADEFCGPLPGRDRLVLWFMWVVTAMAELTRSVSTCATGFPTFRSGCRPWSPWLPDRVEPAVVRVFGELDSGFAA